MHLPAELRTYIYELAFTPPSKAVDLYDARRWAPNRALLLTCRQAYLEAKELYAQAIPIFWSTASFTISNLGRPRLMRQLKRQRPQNLELLRHVKITIPALGYILTVTAEHVPARSPHKPATWQISVSDTQPSCLSRVRRDLISALMLARDSVTSSMSLRLATYRAGGIRVKHSHIRTHEILAMIGTCRRFAGGRRSREITSTWQRRAIRRLPDAAHDSLAPGCQALGPRHIKFDD